MNDTLILNGKEQTVTVPPDMPLLWYLRDILELTGTKFGCGKGLCGACTVHIDGQAVRSCLTPVGSALGKRVTTIEGLSPDGGHPLQIAWIEHRVPQCGYCQAGQLMTAASFLANNPNPDQDDVNRAMQGNICRCGTYNRIKKAVLAAAETLRENAS